MPDAKIPLTHEQIILKTGAEAWKLLEDGLKSSVDGIGGGISFFSPVLFCLMERDFRADPSKKKAIMIWELFLQGNYASPTTKFMRPDPTSGPEWLFLDFILQNVESDGGIREAEFKKTVIAINTIVQSYAAAVQMSAMRRMMSSRTRKVDALASGVSRSMFESYVPYMMKMCGRIYNTGTKYGTIDTMASKLFSNRKKLGGLVAVAGFKPERFGLS